eukprot:CAMPEP_0117692092 /NCGR_PEP_ID=MMETSP0804-20121206/26119_1 /TAXON_ID=1074897 /ORGANISM="Tetraselmis astigmatica, Strain CCMP880" /LENGTH=46 /DNA_ID= /DNA_START= /DNA_END= /DNA_ORIENTATION=
MDGQQALKLALRQHSREVASSMAATGGPPVLTDGPPPNPVISITAA